MGGSRILIRATTVALVALLSVPDLAGADPVPAQAQPFAASTVQSRFEVASVRLMLDRDKLPMMRQMFSMSPPGAAQFTARNITLENLIGLAYKLDSQLQLAGKPAWIDSTYYEIAAKPEGDTGLSHDQLRPYLQTLLQDRFHLAFHHETRYMKGYTLLVAKGGVKLVVSKGDAQHAYLLSERIDTASTPVGTLAGLLGRVVGAPVVDQTGLKGNFDFRLDFAPLEAADSTLPSIFTAVEEQLGLKLEKQSVPVDVFVIDHVDRDPTEN